MRIICISLLLFLSSSAAYCRTIVVAMPSTIKFIDPVGLKSYRETLLVNQLFRTLFKYDERGNIVGDIAKSWYSSENSTVFNITINTNLKFTDGKPIGISDVVFSLARHFWKSQRSSMSTYFTGLIVGANQTNEGKLPEGIVVLSKNTLQIKLTRTGYNFVELLENSAFGIVKKNESHTIGDKTPSSEYVYTKKKNSLEIKLRQPGPNSISYLVKMIKDVGTVSSLAKKNRVDLAIGYGNSNISNMAKQFLQSKAFHHLFFNTKDRFKSKNARLDLLCKLRSIFLKSSPEGFDHSRTLLPPGILPLFYYTGEGRTAIECKKSNLKKSKSVITILVSPYLYGEQLERQIKADARKVGVSIDFVHSDTDEFWDRFENHSYDLIHYGYVGTVNDPEGFLKPFKMGYIQGRPGPGNFDSNELFSEIDSIYNGPILSDKERLKLIAITLQKFENKLLFIPLYSPRRTINFRRGFTVPNLAYKFNFRWNEITQ